MEYDVHNGIGIRSRFGSGLSLRTFHQPGVCETVHGVRQVGFPFGPVDFSLRGGRDEVGSIIRNATPGVSNCRTPSLSFMAPETSSANHSISPSVVLAGIERRPAGFPLPSSVETLVAEPTDWQSHARRWGAWRPRQRWICQAGRDKSYVFEEFLRLRRPRPRTQLASFRSEAW